MVMARKGVCQRLVLATVLAVGFVVVWGLVSMWAAEIGIYVVLSETEDEHVSFLADGTPRVQSLVGRHGDRQYHDLEGKPVPAPDLDDRAGWLTPQPLPAALPTRRAAGDVSWDQRLRSFADGRMPGGYWYFVSDGRPDGTGYLVGYDSQSHVCMGYLGTGGLREGPPPAEELIPFAGQTSGPWARVFCTQRDHSPTGHPVNRAGGRPPRGSVSPWDVYVLGRDGKIYHADLQNRTVHVALDEPRLRSVALVTGPPDPVRGSPHRLAARTDDAVLILDERGQIRQRYPLPEPLRDRGVTFAETTTEEALVYWNSPADSLATAVDYRIFRVAPDGRYREVDVVLRSPGGMRPFQVLGGVVGPSPFVLSGLVAVGRASDLVNDGLEATYPDALGRAFGEFWPALVLAHLLAAGLAVLCYRRQVRYGASGAERVVWPLFVLTFGLPGWVGYRFGRSWPVLESCPACTVRVPRDRECCVCCEIEFPRPALKGTEVFA
jgi:hypothetical protein